MASKGVLEQIEERVGTAVSVIWAVGGPGSGREEQIPTIADKYGYEVIDVSQLLATSEKSGTEYGELIKECKTNGKAVPTHVPVNLVKDAMLNSKDAERFIINGFPNSMDEAFLFERLVGPVSKIVYFDCSAVTKQNRLQSKGEKSLSKTIETFKATVFPVIDQYQLQAKVKKISTDGVPDQVSARVRKHFA